MIFIKFFLEMIKNLYIYIYIYILLLKFAFFLFLQIEKKSIKQKNKKNMYSLIKKYIKMSISELVYLFCETKILLDCLVEKVDWRE